LDRKIQELKKEMEDSEERLKLYKQKIEKNRREDQD
jgi:hypothetical protein